MGNRLTVQQMQRLMRECGIKDASGEAALRVRKFLEGKGVLVPLGQDRYALGPMVKFRHSQDSAMQEEAGKPTWNATE